MKVPTDKCLTSVIMQRGHNSTRIFSWLAFLRLLSSCIVSTYRMARCSQGMCVTFPIRMNLFWHAIQILSRAKALQTDMSLKPLHSQRNSLAWIINDSLWQGLNLWLSLQPSRIYEYRLHYLCHDVIAFHELSIGLPENRWHHILHECRHWL